MLYSFYNSRMETETATESDPVIEAYKIHVDRTLIRENLRLSVQERLLRLAKLQEFAEELRRSCRAERPQP